MIAINSLFTVAGSLSGVFVSIYLWQNSDFATLCRFQIACFAVTPLFFILGGWYAQARDRLHVYRIGLILNAAFYALLLILREHAPHWDIYLGILTGATGGIFWSGANILSYDMTQAGSREYYIGLMSTITGAVGLVAPVLGGVIIEFAPEPHLGYQALFGGVVVLYAICIVLSFWLPKDNVQHPFRLRRALFPKKEQRDWRLTLWTALSIAGSFEILPLVLGLLMFMHTDSEIKLGGFTSFQSLVALAATYAIGNMAGPGNRLTFIFWGIVTFVLAGTLMLFPINMYVLCAFGLLRSIAQPLFGIPHSGLNYDIINNDEEEPSQRIEYICAWEIPLALGRVVVMTAMMYLYEWLRGNEDGLRLAIFLVCAVRVVSYYLIRKTSLIQAEIEAKRTVPAPADENATENEV